MIFTAFFIGFGVMCYVLNISNNHNNPEPCNTVKRYKYNGSNDKFLIFKILACFAVPIFLGWLALYVFIKLT